MIRDKQKNKKRLLIALERHLGNVTEACKEVKLSRCTFYEYCNDDSDFKTTVDEINEITVDFVESALMTKIKEGSERSILFYMRYKARKRGYSDSIDITSGGEKLLTNININIIPPKKDDELE